MPIVDIQGRFGIDIDKWVLLQTGDHPTKRAAKCHSFEKEWIECAHGIGQQRAKVECKIEFEDFYECMHRQKTHDRLYQIRQQRDKLVKEGKYIKPPHHSGKEELRP